MVERHAARTAAARRDRRGASSHDSVAVRGASSRDEDGDQHRVLERRQRAPAARAIDVAPVEVLAAVAVAVDGDEHLGLDLGEAVDQAARRRSRASSTTRSRPMLAQARKATTASGMFGRYGDDPVAATDAEPAQAGRRGRDRSFELGPLDQPERCRSDWKTSAGRSAAARRKTASA